jgi:hypothetical protein
MAKSTNNSALSGVLGNVVFVNQGARSFIRSKPHKVRQTKATKAAASSFGWISQQDKKFRMALTQAYSLVTDSYYAARHRACMAKAQNLSQGSLSATMPQALEGFEFNSLVSWEKTCHFYVTCIQNDNILACHIPALTLGQNVKAPKAVRVADLQFHAFMVDPNQPDIDIMPLGSHQLTLQPLKTVPETQWNLNLPTANTWVVVLGTLMFDYRQSNVAANLRGCAYYLFAKVV